MTVPSADLARSTESSARWGVVLLVIALLLGVAASLAAAVTGPLLPAAGLLVIIVAAALLRYPLVCLALPIVIAPVGLMELPFGGFQFIHVATLAAIAGVLIAVVTGQVRLRPPATAALGLFFVPAMFASAIFSGNPMASLKVGANYLFGASLAIAAAVVVRGSARSMLWLLRCWALASAILVVPALTTLSNVSAAFSGSLVSGRVRGVFKQPNDFGEFAMLGFVASLALVISSPYRRDRVLGSIAMLINLAGVGVSFSRGTWIGLLGCLLTIAVLSPRLRGWTIGFTAGMPVTVVVGALLGIAPFPTILYRLQSLLTGAVNPADDRLILYVHAWDLFVSHPLLGIGPGRFLSSNYDAGSELIRRTYLHGHSVILTVAAEIGLIGVVTLLMFTLALAASTLVARSRLLKARFVVTNARLAVLAGGLVGIAVPGRFAVVSTSPLLIPLAWFLAGLVSGETTRVLDAADLAAQLEEPNRPSRPRAMPIQGADLTVKAGVS